MNLSHKQYKRLYSDTFNTMDKNWNNNFPNNIKQILSKAISTLTDKEQILIEQYYCNSMKPEDVAKSLTISRSWVGLKRQEILAKLYSFIIPYEKILQLMSDNISIKPTHISLELLLLPRNIISRLQIYNIKTLYDLSESIKSEYIYKIPWLGKTNQKTLFTKLQTLGLTDKENKSLINEITIKPFINQLIKNQ